MLSLQEARLVRAFRELGEEDKETQLFIIERFARVTQKVTPDNQPAQNGGGKPLIFNDKT